MENQTLIAMTGGFLALVIMLGIGTLILGSAVTECSTHFSEVFDKRVGNVTLDNTPIYDRPVESLFIVGGGGSGATLSFDAFDIGDFDFADRITNVTLVTKGAEYTSTPSVLVVFQNVPASPPQVNAIFTVTLEEYDETILLDNSGWGKICEKRNTDSQNAYGLLMVVIIVFASAIILIAIRMFRE